VRFGGRRPSPLAPDPDLIRTLAQLLSEHDLSEIEYAVGDRLIRVARVASVAAGAATLPRAGAASPSAAPTETEAATTGGELGAVTAPMVGTVYLAPQPGAPAFVRLGDRVEAGQPLVIIEAMKVMNEIRAPRAGQVVRILVEDGQPVEYGMALMIIE
jgi:acetyl-CoA carboxylase biotin carboxyl carrier protein